jgi:hypothetical protein
LGPSIAGRTTGYSWREPPGGSRSQ